MGIFFVLPGSIFVNKHLHICSVARFMCLVYKVYINKALLRKLTFAEFFTHRASHIFFFLSEFQTLYSEILETCTAETCKVENERYKRGYKLRRVQSSLQITDCNRQERTFISDATTVLPFISFMGAAVIVVRFLLFQLSVTRNLHLTQCFSTSVL